MDTVRKILLSSIGLMISLVSFGQTPCSNYVTWTTGDWIGPSGWNCSGIVDDHEQFYTDGTSVYTHRGYCSSQGPGGFDFLYVEDCDATLPIELFSFTAVQIPYSTVQLDWQTASEINNDYFTIERSVNGTNWEIVNTIDGAGNSSSLLNYTSIDNSPLSGISYYRLKQTDFDGQFSYSNIKNVNIKNLGNSKIEIFPNPTESQITIIGNIIELGQVKIYNTLGQDLTNFTNKIDSGKLKLIIDLSELNEGMYYIKTKTTANKVYKQ